MEIICEKHHQRLAVPDETQETWGFVQTLSGHHRGSTRSTSPMHGVGLQNWALKQLKVRGPVSTPFLPP